MITYIKKKLYLKYSVMKLITQYVRYITISFILIVFRKEKKRKKKKT